MTIQNYNPSPKQDRKQFYAMRTRAYMRIIRLENDESGNVAFLRRGNLPLLNINGVTVILGRPDFLAVPLVTLLGNSIKSIRKVKSLLEEKIEVKLRKK